MGDTEIGVVGDTYSRFLANFSASWATPKKGIPQMVKGTEINGKNARNAHGFTFKLLSVVGDTIYIHLPGGMGF